MKGWCQLWTDNLLSTTPPESPGQRKADGTLTLVLQPITKKKKKGSRMASSWMMPEETDSELHLCFWKRPAASRKWDKQPVWFSCSRQSRPVSCVWLCLPCLVSLPPVALGYATLGAVSPPLMFPQQTDIKVPCVPRIKRS